MAMLVEIAWARKFPHDAADESCWQRQVGLSILLIPVLKLLIIALVSM